MSVDIVGMKPAKNAGVRVFFTPTWFVTERCKCGYNVPIELGAESGACAACGEMVEAKPPAAEP